MLTAKFHGRLATLSLDEIPEALEYLLQEERTDNQNDPPWEASSEVILLLSRWYELEGDYALDWIQNHHQWTHLAKFEARQVTILDGFHREPQRSFELLLEMKTQIQEDETTYEIQNISLSSLDNRSILYEIARWSNSPLEMLRTLDPEGHFLKSYTPSSFPPSDTPLDLTSVVSGFPVTPASPTSFSSNSEMESFARGLADSNRFDLVRQLSSEFDGSAREALQEVLRHEARKEGWQEVKRQIDQGILDPTQDHFAEVLSSLAKENRDEALSWYLSLPESEALTRADRIASTILASGPFEIPTQPNDDPFATAGFDFAAAHQWLANLQAQGEPIERAASVLHREALRWRNWDIVKQNRKFLPESDWRRFEEEIILAAMGRENETIRGQELTWADKPNQTWLEAAAELNLIDQVHAKAQETNAQSRANLRALLERLEASQ